MRVIVNLVSDNAATAAGWRARAIQIPDKTEALLNDILEGAVLKNGSGIGALISERGKLKKGWILYVNGIRFNSGSELCVKVKDSVQIHVMNEKIDRHYRTE